MKRSSFFISILGLFLILLVPSYASAKSGCCSGHGGVSCVAGSQSNGNVICNDGWTGSSCLYSEMVMCRGSSSTTTINANSTNTTVVTPTPIKTPTPKPTLAPTVKPSQTSISTPAPRLTPTSIATPTPVVEGVSTQNTSNPTTNPTEIPSPTPTSKPLTAGEMTMALGVLFVMFALPLWVIVKIVKKFRK